MRDLCPTVGVWENTQPSQDRRWQHVLLEGELFNKCVECEMILIEMLLFPWNWYLGSKVEATINYSSVPFPQFCILWVQVFAFSFTQIQKWSENINRKIPGINNSCMLSSMLF